MPPTAKPPVKSKPVTLYIVRTFRVPRDTLFQAFTVPKELRRWWLPEEGYTVAEVEIDAKPKGRWRVGMKPPGLEEPYFVTGVYRQVSPGALLSFSWEWEGERTWSAEPAKTRAPETQVTLQFKSRGDSSTELFLQHDGFRDERDRDDHRWGWSGILDKLSALV